MARILKLPVSNSKLGFRRVRKRVRLADHPDQLDLFPGPGAEILAFTPLDLSSFEQALFFDERGDARASELYRKAIAEQDCIADAYCNLGILESQNGQSLRAFDCFTAALQHDPRHSEAHYNLANLYFDQDDFRLAQLHFGMATEVDPNFANAYFNLALVQSLNNDPAAAIQALSRYRELVSEDEARIADDLLQNLQKSLAAGNHPRFA